VREQRHFPQIIALRTKGRVEAVAGMKLGSLLKRDLLVSPLDGKDMPESTLWTALLSRMADNRKGLIHAISSWPANITLELHINSIPDLSNKAGSRVLISLFLKAFGQSVDQVKEEVATRYLVLRPLLAAHWPEAEFFPVISRKELKARTTPFQAKKAIALCRRKECLPLSAPLRRLSLGFGPMEWRQNTKDSTVKHIFPWVPSRDDWSRLFDTHLGQLDPLQIIIRLGPARLREEAVAELLQTIRTCETFMAGIHGHEITLSRQVGLIRDVALAHLAEIKECSFNLGVFILSPGAIDPSITNVLERSITRLEGMANDQNPFTGGFRAREMDPKLVSKGNFFPEQDPFSITEAGAAFRLPFPSLEDRPGLPLRRSRTSFALVKPHSNIDEGFELVINEHYGMEQPIFMGLQDRLRHVFIIGQTGTGKSTLMERMIMQDIRAGRGVALIDPHGDLVESVLGRIPREREDDVILFDMLESARPIGFNLLEWKTIDERDLIIDEMYQSLDRLYDMRQVGGPIFELNFRGMLKLLMGDKHHNDFVPTVLEFTQCYLSAEFRDWLRKRTHDPQTLDFLKELERTGGDASLANLSPYITSKFSRFVHDTRLTRILGQERTSFDFDEIMNERKILLVNLGKGRFGPYASALLANQLVTRFKLAAMKRGEIPPEKRKEFFLYVDECHNLPSENFCELLSEARKFGMGLVLATQYTAQLKAAKHGNMDLLSAILGNVGTILIFRLGHEDAISMAPALYPIFSSVDITGLANWHGYARMQINGDATPPFSFKTRKDPSSYKKTTARRIRTLSNRKYGCRASTIDAQIRRRRTVWKKEQKTK